MPEKVTKEERQITMLIEKAREVKEMLYQSLMDNNRSPQEDDNEVVKIKRPKAENDTTKIENNTGTHSGYGLSGDMVEFKKMLKNILPEDYENNPVWEKDKVRQNIGSSIETNNSLNRLQEEMNNIIDNYQKQEINSNEFATQLETVYNEIIRLERKLIREPKQFKKMDIDMNVGDGYALDLGDSVQFGRFEDKNKNIVVGKNALVKILQRYDKEVREKEGLPPLKRLTQITMSSGPTSDFMKFLRQIFNYA